MIASLLIGLLPLVPTDDAEGATAQLHPYFERATAWVHDPSVPAVEVDGQLLPHRFTVPTTTQHFHLEEAGPLEFVLVLPNAAHVDGVELPVASPFYMCTTELSNAQFAQLRYFGKLRTYADFEADMSFASRLDPDVGGCDLDHVAGYFTNPRKPVVGIDLADAAVVSRRLSNRVFGNPCG